ncbi:MAG: GNAT family N-acetyltransferase [Paludibacteraceae bacterium]|nr:GNAT family N-acetyltransferase [Paludibacteraceae bacterium]
MLTKQKIYFRADAGADIGYGHFIRSLALADMLKSDFECVMFTQEPTPYQISEAENVCQLVSLPVDESRFDKFLTYLTGNEIVVLDNYFYTTEYQRQIKDKGCKLVCIDDIHDKHFVADVVINHSLVDESVYDVEPYTKVCTTPKYALLRPAFFEDYPIKKVPGSWIVTIGGLDEPNVTEKMVRLLQAQGISYIVAIVGDGYRHLESLKMCGIKILSRLSANNMASAFAQAENVVCCASTVCYEALSQGCHVYAGWYVDNQEEIYNRLVQSNCIEPLGNLLLLRSIEIKQTNALAKMDFNRVRPHIRSIFYRLALRVVNYVDLTQAESWQVWATRNLPEIRQWMVNKNTFSYEDHCLFIESLKTSKDKLYYAFFIGDEFVGSYDIKDRIPRMIVECGLFLHPSWWKRGLGHVIEEKMEQLVKSMSIAIIASDVYLDNEQSRKYFIRNNFEEISRDEKFIHFEKTL